MAQNKFEAEISQSLRKMNENHNFYSGRFFDTKSFMGRAKFAIKQPADFWALWSGRATLMELKSQKNEPSFDTSKIAVHQWEDLLHVEETGNNALFLLCRSGTPRKNQCFAITPSRLNGIIECSGKKSIRWEIIQENSLEIPKVDSMWDLSILFNGFRKTPPEPPQELSPQALEWHVDYT